MLMIRVFEESVLAAFHEGVMAGTTHTCIGQEATAVGVVAALDRELDIICSNHRGHGHFLAYCGEVERLFLELLGKPGGVCAGRGGSQHLHYRNYYSNGIVGGMIPVTAGMALAEKIKDTQSVAVVFLGDGALGQGVVYESFNIASLWGLPVLFVLENNRYAQSTPCELHIAGAMVARPRAFGITSHECHTTNVMDILELSCELVHAVRTKREPICMVIHNYRLGPHSKGDDHRALEEIRAARQRDPVKIAETVLGSKVVGKVKKEVVTLVDAAKKRALEAVSHGFENA
jgi:TPP-dependent pyruvate/acetoin dehydrogenase alpha subunit